MELSADEEAHLARLPEPQRGRVRQMLADPARHGQRRLGPCEFEGPLIRRWPSGCASKVELLSVRACNHPQPGECSRGENAAHQVAGVRVCHGRGCPLVGNFPTSRLESDRPAP